MKIAYIAGSYRARTKLGVIMNILRARRVAIKYWKIGYAVICPHMNTALFDGHCADSVWLKGDREILTRCDVVVMMENWKKSAGARAEHELAKACNIPVIYDKHGGFAYLYNQRNCHAE